MKFLLTSNGLTSPALEQAFAEFTDHRSNLKIALIPTASDPIEWVPESEGSEKYVAKLIEKDVPKHKTYLDNRKKEYEQNGYQTTIVDLKDTPERIQETLNNVDVIQVPGGDANYLLDWAKAAKLDTYLEDLLEKGVVYVGESAGSSLLLPDIGLTWWEPTEKWEDTDHVGFGIVDFVVVVHQKEAELHANMKKYQERRSYLQSVTDFPWDIYLLQDGQAIKVDGNTVEHIGPGEKRRI